MKVLLVDPPELFLRGLGHTRQVQPLGLAYVGAAIADLCEVRFLLPDTRTYTGGDPWGELFAAIESEAPDLIGITAVTATFTTAATLADGIRARWPTVPIVLGGVHASTLPSESLRAAPAIDCVVRGEGENAMRELVLAMRVHGPAAVRSPSSIAGLWWRDGEAIKSSPPRPAVADLDSLPMPLREGFVWPDDVQDGLYQAVVTLRGCPYRCIYCAVPSLDDRRTRYRSAANIADEIASLRERHGIDYLFFHDSVFTLHRKRTLALCDTLIERGLQTPFCCQTRADRLDAELLDRMVDAGLHQVFFGIESGDPESLRRIRKDMPLATITTAVELVRSRGVRCSGFFMIGFPWQDAKIMQQTADFAVGLGLDAVSLFSATPLPGTELWDMSQGAAFPDSIDFRAPQVNLTALGDEAYAALYGRIQAQLAQHNTDRMLAGLGDARRDWMQLEPAPSER